MNVNLFQDRENVIISQEMARNSLILKLTKALEKQPRMAKNYHIISWHISCKNRPRRNQSLIKHISKSRISSFTRDRKLQVSSRLMMKIIKNSIARSISNPRSKNSFLVKVEGRSICGTYRCIHSKPHLCHSLK